jgi:transcriptional regulator with XRE-family HTH domain
VDATISHEGSLKSAEQLGAAIRRLRIARKLSLQRLAKSSQVSAGMLSQIERNLASPSLRTLTKIRLALNVPLSAFFDEVHEDDSPSFVRRAGSRPIIDLGDRLLLKELLSPATAQSVQFMFLTIPPGGGSGEMPLSYPSEKAGLVTEGQITLQVDATSTTVSEGDSFQFNGALPHRLQNDSDKQAKVLWMIAQLSPERHL